MKLLNPLVPQNIILTGNKFTADMNTETFLVSVSIVSHFKAILNKNYEIICSQIVNMLVNTKLQKYIIWWQEDILRKAPHWVCIVLIQQYTFSQVCTAQLNRQTRSP